MPETLRLPERLRIEIIAHCLAATPNEGCGLFALEEDEITEIYPTANADPSPTGYTVPPEEHFAAIEDAESKGYVIGGSFHSHPTGPARPSVVDAMRALDPEWRYLVVGLRGEPEVRAWRFLNGEAREVILT